MTKVFRRKAPRRRFDGKAGVLYRGKMWVTPCTQLGEGGALIDLDGDLAPMQTGDELVITLFLPNIGGVVATAQCVYRSEDDKAGLQFSGLNTAYKKKVREFVSRRKSVEVV